MQMTKEIPETADQQLMRRVRRRARIKIIAADAAMGLAACALVVAGTAILGSVPTMRGLGAAMIAGAVGVMLLSTMLWSSEFG
jgi:hypothetical protein